MTTIVKGPIAHRTVSVVDSADPASATATTDGQGTTIAIVNPLGTYPAQDDANFLCQFTVASGAPASATLQAKVYDANAAKWFNVPGATLTLSIASGQTSATPTLLRVSTEGLPCYLAVTGLSGGVTPSVAIDYDVTT